MLVKSQPISDAVTALTAKSQHPYKDPYYISKLIPSATFKLPDKGGKIRGEFNNKALKPYQEETNASS